MKLGDTRTENRREFLRSLGRTTILGTIGALICVLFPRVRRPDARAHTCVNQGLCRKCAAFDDCILPQALSAKSRTSDLSDRSDTATGNLSVAGPAGAGPGPTAPATDKTNPGKHD